MRLEVENLMGIEKVEFDLLPGRVVELVGVRSKYSNAQHREAA